MFKTDNSFSDEKLINDTILSILTILSNLINCVYFFFLKLNN